MTNQDKEKLINRILSNSVRIIINNKVYWLTSPKPIDRLNASYVYEDILQESESAGVPLESDYLQMANEDGSWSKELEKELKTCIDNIDKLKIEYYQSCFKQSRKELAAKGLNKTKAYYSILINKKNKNYGYTAEAIAETAKYKYIIGKCLLLSDNKTQVWNGDDFLQDNSELLNSAYTSWANLKLNEAEIRELARSDYWRSFWNTRSDVKSLVDVSSAYLSDELKSLIAWSKIYDSAFEDSAFFGEVALNDDDMFDGYLLLRRKEREKQNSKSRGEGLLSGSKNANAGEIYVPVDSIEEAQDVENLNDDKNAMIKKQRLKQLESKGVIHEAEMFDSKQEIIAQFNQKRRGK